MNRFRWWTSGEINRLRDLRQRNFSIAEIAQALGRSIASVRSQAERSCIRRFVGPDPDRIQRALHRWNPQGWSDGRIARHLGVTQSCVSRYRRRLGLPVVPRTTNTDRCRRQTESRERRWAEAAALAGWPAVPPGQRRILEALESLGDSGTIAQVNGVNGTRYVGCRSRLWAELVALGFVVPVHAERHGGVSGSRPAVFAIADDVAERRTRHLQREAS